MNPVSHQNIAHPEMVAKLFKSGETMQQELTPIDLEIIHATIGIVGELGELLAGVEFAMAHSQKPDRENIVEELGDYEFYMEHLRTKLNITRDEVLTYPDVCIVPSGPVRTAAHMLVYSTDLLDHIKKMVVYRKPIDRPNILLNMSKIEYLLTPFRVYFLISYEETIAANIEKLSIRYKGFQYSDQQAQDRADKCHGSEANVIPMNNENLS